MKYISLTLFSLIFLFHTTLWANDPIEAEDIIQEEVIQEEPVAEEVAPNTDNEASDEAIEPKNSKEEADSNTPTPEEVEAAEAAQAEEAELREVGAGEEPIAE